VTSTMEREVEVRTVIYEMWIPADLILKPSVWRMRYNDAVTRMGFIEYAPPVLVKDTAGQHIARGVVLAAPLPSR